jgi:hypothetical protein
MDDTKSKVFKLILICLICVGLIAGLTILIQNLV